MCRLISTDLRAVALDSYLKTGIQWGAVGSKIDDSKYSIKLGIGKG